MSDRFKQLTKSQLVAYFKDYREAFPEWSVENELVLYRSAGLVKQIITLEDLRSGGYRPLHYVNFPGPPNRGQLLYGFLSVRYRQIRPREHIAKWPLVVKAMEEEFLPPVREPLDPAQVLRYAEEKVTRPETENANVLASLAVLSVYLGDSDRALKWCDRSISRLANIGRDLAAWEMQLASFNQRLRQAVQAGSAREFLQEESHQRPISG